jgi:kinesin family protein 15
LEIYNEQIIDLLSENKAGQLTIREDVRKGVYVENLTEFTTENFSQTMSALL